MPSSPRAPNQSAKTIENIDPDVLKFYDLGELGDVAIYYKKARDLLRFDRLDIISRYIYVKHQMSRQGPSNIGEDVYWHYLLSVQKSRATFFKDGDGRKNSYQDYIQNFNKIIYAMKDGEFDFDREAAPICEQTLVGNAHRVAAAAYFDAEIPCVTVYGDPKAHQSDYNGMIRAGINRHYIDYVIRTYMDLTKRCHFLFLFPEAINKLKECEKAIREHADIVYHKDLLLTDGGVEHVVKLAYDHNDWWQEKLTKKFIGARFPEFGALRVYVVELKEGISCADLKTEVRKLFSAEEPCIIHSSDTISDAEHYAKHLLNENWVFFANHRLPNKDPEFDEKLSVYKARLREQEVAGRDADSYCVDSGAVLGLFGIRKADDIDYICSDVFDEMEQDRVTSNHNKEYMPLGINIHEIIENSAFHFFHRGVKFMSLDCVAQFKFRRCSKKDVEDFSAISQFLAKEDLHKFEVTS